MPVRQVNNRKLLWRDVRREFLAVFFKPGVQDVKEFLLVGSQEGGGVLEVSADCRGGAEDPGEA